LAFLNPERVERQGGQNQLCERSTEKGFFKEKHEEKIEGKISTDLLELGAFLRGPTGKPKSAQNDQKVRD